MRSIHFAVFLVVCFCLYALPAQAALVWRPGEGWTDDRGAGMESSSKDQLLHAQTLETAGDLPSAYKAYKGLARKWPRSYSAPEAHFKMAWLELRSGSPYMALKTALKLMIDYPGSVFAWYAMFITIVVVAGLILITYAVTRRGLRRIKPKPEPEPALT